MSGEFPALGLSDDALKTLDSLGYEKPTPVQAQAIPVLLAGRDLIAQAQTGTGKTAAFALPLVERLAGTPTTPQALVLCPTRELTMQVSGAIWRLGGARGVKVVGIYGGQPIFRQIKALEAGVHVVVATPGRLLDHLRRGTLKPESVRTIVLDEADEMLAMGFIEDITSILDQMPAERQVALFSATMPAPIAKLAQRYQKEPQRVTIDGGKQPVAAIRQSYYEVLPQNKLEALIRIFDLETPGPTMVFCRTRTSAEQVGERLASQGLLADRIHGDLTQQDRDRVMKRFREGTVEVLVATDVAARGLDIETVTHVINFDIPWDAESYTHRIGRTGRAGREGDAITLVEPRERRHLRTIERATGSKIKPMRIPTLADIRTRRQDKFREKLAAAAAEATDEDRALVAELSQTLPVADLAAAAVKLLRAKEPQRDRESEADINLAPPTESGMVRLVITAGRLENIRRGDLVGAISNEAGLPGDRIGTIEIFPHASFVEVPADRVDDVIHALERTRLRGRKVRVERANRDGQRRRDHVARPHGAMRRDGPPHRTDGKPPRRPDRPYTGPGRPPEPKPDRAPGERPPRRPDGPPGKPFQKPFKKPFKRPFPKRPAPGA